MNYLGELSIVVMPGCEELGEKVQRYLNRLRKNKANYIADISLTRFATGEAKAFANESMRGKDVYIVVDVFNHSVKYKMYGQEVPKSPDDHYQDLKRVIGAIGGKAKRITVIMPMLYEGRQHRRNGRESLDCAIMLQELVSIGVTNILTFDAHDGRVCNAIPLSGFDNVHPTYQMIKTLLREVPDVKIDDKKLAIISPDEGGMSRCLYYSSVLGVNVGMFYKRRDYSRVVDGRNPIEAHEYLGRNVAGKDIIVVDDMISSGESMLDVCRILKEKGAKRIFVFVSFGLFTNGLEKFDEAYKKKEINKIFTTNLIYRTPELLTKKWYKEVDMSKYISYLIECLNRDSSISSLIDPFTKIKELIEKHKD